MYARVWNVVAQEKADAGEPLVALGPGSMTVDEFNDLVFRASYSGSMCRVTELKPKTDCPNPVAVRGRIVKAFAGSGLPGQHMKIERTHGTEMYRKANEAGMAACSEPPGVRRKWTGREDAVGPCLSTTP